MNKLIVIAILISFGSCQLIKAQSNYFRISFKGGTEVEVWRNKGPWSRNGLALPLSENDSIQIKKGKVDLSKYKLSKSICETPPISINDAWSKPSCPTSLPKCSSYGTPMGGMPISGNDSIRVGLGFITTKGEWRDSCYTKDLIIEEKDTLKSMVINHTSCDTLYAYAYWVFSDSVYHRFSLVIDDSCCTLLPGYNNIIEFNRLQPIRTKEPSRIYLIWSNEYMPEPEKVPYFSDFQENAYYKGFKVVFLNINVKL